MIPNTLTSPPSTTGGWTYDLNKNELLWSTATRDLHGQPSGFQPDICDIDKLYVPVENKLRFSEIIKLCVSGVDYFKEDLHLIHPNGTVNKIICSGIIDKSDAANPIILGSFETTKQTSQERKRNSPNHTTNHRVGSWTWDLTTNKVTWSPELCEILEIPFEEVNKKELTPASFLTFVHPDDLEWINRSTEKMTLEKKAIGNYFSVVTGSGKAVRVFATSESVFNKKGEVQAFHGFVQDLSMSNHIQRKVSDFFHLGTELMAILNLNGHFIDVNPQWEVTLGYNSAELTSKNILDIVHPDDTTRVESAMNMLRQGRVLKQFTLRLLDADKNYKWIEISCIPDVREGLIVTNARDISEQISTNETLLSFNRELQKKNKELEQFAFITSHDLQEPMNTIQSMVHMLKQDTASKLNMEELQLMGYIEEASDRMSEQIKGILDYSRIGRNPAMEEINLNTKVTEILSDLNVLVQRHGTQIEVAELPLISGVKTDIRMLFQNLISNAIKFSSTAKEPTVTISSKELTGHFEFTISDNGIGIDPKYHDNIFQIFKRLNSRDEFEGTGIGLAYCKKIIALHDGSIKVDSNLNEGAKFIFTLSKKN